MNKREIVLSNTDIHEYCLLNLETNEITYDDKPKREGFMGLYHKDENNFFALYPTAQGPMIYFKGREYPINKSLHIRVEKDGKDRKFTISEYQIEISYLESKYLDWDCWSSEEDVDLFYNIEQNYKDDSFYEVYTEVDPRITAVTTLRWPTVNEMAVLNEINTGKDTI